MRKSEEKFTSAATRKKAEGLGRQILAVRLGRNLTQEAAAERSRMSQYTWLKIEKGNVSVSLGAWLSAMECLGLLECLVLPDTPLAPAKSARLRARQSPSADAAYDF
jgi:hypothetical protein